MSYGCILVYFDSYLTHMKVNITKQISQGDKSGGESHTGAFWFILVVI